MSEILYRALLTELIEATEGRDDQDTWAFKVCEISRRARLCIEEATPPWEDCPLVNPQLDV